MSLRIIELSTDKQDELERESAAALASRAPSTRRRQQPRDVGLRLELLEAAELAAPGEPCGGALYRAVMSVSPFATEMMSPAAVGWPDPQWRRRWEQRIEGFRWGARLRVEVLRLQEMAEPGTSAGTTVVGRAEIDLPRRLRKKKGGRFHLVRCDGGECRTQGFVTLTLELLPLEDPQVRHRKRHGYY